MIFRNHRGLIGFLMASLFACGRESFERPPALAQAAAMRSGPRTLRARELAPHVYAEAEIARKKAEQALAEGDSLGSDLLGEEAQADYVRAVAIVDLAESARARAESEALLLEKDARAKTTAARRKEAELTGAELDRTLTGLREKILRASREPVTPEREAARRKAARAMKVEARLFCHAAKLTGATDGPEIDALNSLGQDPLTTPAKTQVPPTDALALLERSSHLRLGCVRKLALLQKDMSSEYPLRVDRLFHELSLRRAEKSPPWELARDERGIVLTGRRKAKEPLASAFEDLDLKSVLGAHPDFVVQIVMHSSAPLSGSEIERQEAEGEEFYRSLAAGEARAHVEVVGSDLPAVDPTDEKSRARNARVDVVLLPK